MATSVGPENSEQPQPLTTVGIGLLLVAAAALVFGFGIGREPLWLDETFSFAMVQHGFRGIVKFTAEDVHPPLYYFWLLLTTRAFGTGEMALRAPSLLAALFLVGLGMGPVRRLFGAPAGYAYMVLAIASPGIVAFAQEARMYTLLAASVTASVLYGYLAVARGERHALFKHAGATVVAFYTHYYGALAGGLGMLMLLGLAFRFHRQRWKALAWAHLAVALGYLPWAVVAAQHLIKVSRDFWIPWPGARYVVFALAAPFTYKFEDISFPWQAPVALAVGGALAGRALWAFHRRGERERLIGLALLLGVFGGTLTFALGYSWTVQPVLMPRYMLACSGLLLIAIAVGSASLPRNVGVALLGVLCLLGLPATLRVVGARFNGPFRELAEVAGAATHDTFLHTDLQTLYPSWHALPEARHVLLFDAGAGVWDPGQGVYQSNRLWGTNDLSSALGAANRVWWVDMTNGGYRLPTGAIEAIPGWKRVAGEHRLDLPWSWVKLQAIAFERPGPRGSAESLQRDLR